MKTKGRREHKKGIALYYKAEDIYGDTWGEPEVVPHRCTIINTKQFTTEVVGTLIDNSFVKVKRYTEFCNYINPKLKENPELSPQQITFMWNIFKNK